MIGTGRFEVTLMYVCAEDNVGGKVRVEVGGKSLEAVVSKAHDPDRYPAPTASLAAKFMKRSGHR